MCPRWQGWARAGQVGSTVLVLDHSALVSVVQGGKDFFSLEKKITTSEVLALCGFGVTAAPYPWDKAPAQVAVVHRSKSKLSLPQAPLTGVPRTLLHPSGRAGESAVLGRNSWRPI